MNSYNSFNKHSWHLVTLRILRCREALNLQSRAQPHGTWWLWSCAMGVLLGWAIVDVIEYIAYNCQTHLSQVVTCMVMYLKIDRVKLPWLSLFCDIEWSSKAVHQPHEAEIQTSEDTENCEDWAWVNSAHASIVYPLVRSWFKSLWHHYSFFYTIMYTNRI